MNKIFKVEKELDDLVVIRVGALTLLDIALHPFLNGNMAYISATRGDQHTFTVVNKDGTTWSWDYGAKHSTMVDDNTKRLQRAIENFLIENGVLLENKTTKLPDHCSIYYNKTFNAWCARIGQQNIINKEVKNEDSMVSYLKKIFGIKKKLRTSYNLAPTGIYVCTVYF